MALLASQARDTNLVTTSQQLEPAGDDMRLRSLSAVGPARPKRVSEAHSQPFATPICYCFMKKQLIPHFECLERGARPNLKRQSIFMELLVYTSAHPVLRGVRTFSKRSILMGKKKELSIRIISSGQFVLSQVRNVIFLAICFVLYISYCSSKSISTRTSQTKYVCSRDTDDMNKNNGLQLASAVEQTLLATNPVGVFQQMILLVLARVDTTRLWLVTRVRTRTAQCCSGQTRSQLAYFAHVFQQDIQ